MHTETTRNVTTHRFSRLLLLVNSRQSSNLDFKCRFKLLLSPTWLGCRIEYFSPAPFGPDPSGLQIA
jgi:hypothetical protein